MRHAKLSSTYRVSIPKAIRETMNLQAGQQFTVMPRGNVIELIPFRSLSDARGLLSDCRYEDSSEYRDRENRKL